MLTHLLVSAALAHGPAPVALEVLAWDDAPGCTTVPAAATPGLVRTNIGLAAHLGDGTYDYRCPSRWGDDEQALAAASPAGTQVLLAGTQGLWWSGDGSCSAQALPLAADETPVDLRWHDGGFLFVSRNFQAQTGTLWRVADGELSRQASWSDRFVDGLGVDADGVWVSGARPSPFVARWDGAELGDDVVLPDGQEVQRLSARGGDGTVRFVVATTDAGRALWRAVGGVAQEVLAPVAVLHGPVKVSGTWLVVADGEVWQGGTDGETWAGTGTEVDWTCLREHGARAQACSLAALRVLTGWAAGEPELVDVFTMTQIGAPAPSCDGVAGACALDWLHYAGESGWVGTLPAPCPGAPRPIPLDGPPEVVPGCGCSHGRPGAAGWLGWGLLLAIRTGRRRPSTG